MFTDGAYSSAAFPSNPRTLVFDYYKFYDLMFWNRDVRNVLMLGGAGMGYPRYVAASYPNMTMTVVEIDPKLYEIAKRSMGYVPSESVRMVFEDGRVFLNSNEKKFDAILIDVFSAHSIPWHLVTVESIRRVKQSLTEDGLVVVNIISSFNGDREKILQSIASTYKHVFDTVEVFSVQRMARPTDAQNIILVAANKPLNFTNNNLSARSKSLLSHIRPLEMNGRVLTDDWSPIDSYTESILNR
jgi:spermidine synthase